MSVLLTAEQLKDALDGLAERIATDLGGGVGIATVGIRSRGEIIAQRLAESLGKRLGKNIQRGTLDITLYRDDLNSPDQPAAPQVRTTEIGFSIDDMMIILVDDVLFTGRSTRAALDALVDLGRPKAIKLAVLIERVGRELPIQADYIGYKADVDADKLVQVRLVEPDGKDEVTVE